MTLFDYQQFNKIRPWELLDNNFMKKETSPNIAFIADRFSQVYRPEYDAFNLAKLTSSQISRWIASELLTTPNSKQRAKIISQFISLAQVSIPKGKRKSSQTKTHNNLGVRDLTQKIIFVNHSVI